jgi:hypothetical protein
LALITVKEKRTSASKGTDGKEGKRKNRDRMEKVLTITIETRRLLDR